VSAKDWIGRVEARRSLEDSKFLTDGSPGDRSPVRDPAVDRVATYELDGGTRELAGDPPADPPEGPWLLAGAARDQVRPRAAADDGRGRPGGLVGPDAGRTPAEGRDDHRRRQTAASGGRVGRRVVFAVARPLAASGNPGGTSTRPSSRSSVRPRRQVRREPRTRPARPGRGTPRGGGQRLGPSRNPGPRARIARRKTHKTEALRHRAQLNGLASVCGSRPGGQFRPPDRRP
jgi:hypothetical protein